MNKTVDEILSIHEAQQLTYMRLSQMKLGVLWKWKVKLMKNGIKGMMI